MKETKGRRVKSDETKRGKKGAKKNNKFATKINAIKKKRKRENVRVLFGKFSKQLEMEILLLLNLKQKIDFFFFLLPLISF